MVHDVLDAAPELLGGKGYGKEVDWWSFGTLLYEMLTGQPPFVNDDREVMYSKIMNEKLQLPTKIGEVQLHQIVHATTNSVNCGRMLHTRRLWIC